MKTPDTTSSAATLRRYIADSATRLDTLDVPALARVMHCSVGHVRRLLRTNGKEMPKPRRAPGGGHKIFFIAQEVAEWLQKLPSADSPSRKRSQEEKTP
jgi:hypothetical protein